MDTILGVGRGRSGAGKSEKKEREFFYGECREIVLTKSGDPPWQEW